MDRQRGGGREGGKGGMGGREERKEGRGRRRGEVPDPASRGGLVGEGAPVVMKGTELEKLINSKLSWELA